MGRSSLSFGFVLLTWRENASASTLACFAIVGIQAISGNATLRILLYETDKLTYDRFCRWSGQPVPKPGSIFLEQPDSVRVVRDLSTVEELELALALSRYALHLFDAPENLTKDQLSSLMEAHGKHLRATFIVRHGYLPEDSTTPYVPVTIEGPQDHDAYYGKEYP